MAYVKIPETMKKKLIIFIILSVVLSVMNGCGDDNPNSPDVEQQKPVTALTPSFWETYGFRAKERRVSNLDTLVIPVGGVLTYRTTDYVAGVPISNDMVTIREGVEYTPSGNPNWYNLFARKFNDIACPVRDDDMMTYHPHPYAITSITMRLDRDDVNRWIYDQKNDEFTPAYNPNYQVDKDCTSLFKIRYRSYYEYIQNSYSWEGLENDGPWYEMDLVDFNAQGGAKMVDISEFYLIAKEKPLGSIYMVFNKLRFFDMTMTFENGRKNHKNRHLVIFSCF